MEGENNKYQHMNEIWKDIVGYEGKYRVSTLGEVESVYRMTNIHGVPMRINIPQTMKKSKDVKGYEIVNLYDGEGNGKSMKVHRLVAMAFLPNPDNKRCVCHKDNNPQNNRVDNLYWGTDMENQQQAWKDGLHKNRMSVSQYTKEGKLVDTFISMSEASRQTHIPQANIWKSIQGLRKSAGGFIWQKSV